MVLILFQTQLLKFADGSASMNVQRKLIVRTISIQISHSNQDLKTYNQMFK